VNGGWCLVDRGKRSEVSLLREGYGGQGGQTAGDGSDNLLLALHSAAGHSEAINVSHIL